LLLRPSLEDEAAILDLGTGSVIPAIFAAKVGFKEILSLDIDPVARETASRNITTNRLESVIEIRDEPFGLQQRAHCL
jgi:ribosomal protein L11 methylase PrmA